MAETGRERLEAGASAANGRFLRQSCRQCYRLGFGRHLARPIFDSLRALLNVLGHDAQGDFINAPRGNVQADRTCDACQGFWTRDLFLDELVKDKPFFAALPIMPRNSERLVNPMPQHERIVAVTAGDDQAEGGRCGAAVQRDPAAPRSRRAGWLRPGSNRELASAGRSSNTVTLKSRLQRRVARRPGRCGRHRRSTARRAA